MKYYYSYYIYFEKTELVTTKKKQYFYNLIGQENKEINEATDDKIVSGDWKVVGMRNEHQFQELMYDHYYKN